MAGLKEQVADTGVFVIANLANLLMIVLFLSRVVKARRVEFYVGLGLEALGLPLVAAVLWSLLQKREWWTVVLPSLLIAFLIVELILDYMLKLDFRHTAWLGPYLGLYYLALMGMIGYTFLVSKPYGFITLATYFLNLLATWFSYARVGHG